MPNTRTTRTIGADVKVGISMGGMEYRFLRSEMEDHINTLQDRQQGMRPGKVKSALRVREQTLRALLEKL